MTKIDETLNSLRDVQGVMGSFVVAGSGAVIARDLPPVFDAGLLAEVGPRVIRLYETFLTGAEELDAAMIRYAEHKLYLRRMTWGVVAVLSTVNVNLPALRMVSNLVIRKIDPDVSPSMTPAPPAVATLPSPLGGDRPSAPPNTPAAVVDQAQPPPSRQVRMYRGRPVVDE